MGKLTWVALLALGCGVAEDEDATEEWGERGQAVEVIDPMLCGSTGPGEVLFPCPEPIDCAKLGQDHARSVAERAACGQPGVMDAVE